MLAGQENLRKMVREEVEKVIRASGLLIKYREISDADAEKEITELIIRLRAAGNKKISALDIVSILVLPPEQIERILEKFENSGRLSEFNE